MRVRIDQELCIGDGICEEICPEVFEVRDDGLAYVIDEEPDETLWPKVESAAEECPTDAIILEEEYLEAEAS